LAGLGVVMSGFVSVPSRRGAGVVARAGADGVIWAWRALPGGAGWSPAPACLFVPCSCFPSAAALARRAASLGWRAWVRRGTAGSPVWGACGLPVPAFVAKVALPAGTSAAAARAALGVGVA